MNTLERNLHNLDVICADMQAAIKDATDAARTSEDLTLLDERLSVTAHWLANQRQTVRLSLEMARRHVTTPEVDTTGGS